MGLTSSNTSRVQSTLSGGEWADNRTEPFPFGGDGVNRTEAFPLGGNQTEPFLVGGDGNLNDMSLNYRILATSLHTLIFCVGFLGNILLIVVAHKARSLQTPTYSYLVSLAYADLLVITTAIPEAIVFHNIGNNWLLGNAGCAIFVYLNFLGINAGSLNILAFTVERFFTISKPLLARTLCTMERTKRVILITWIFTIIYCSPWFGLTEVRSDDVHPDRKNCDFRLSRELYIAVFGADLVLFYIVPLVVAVVVYAKIARILCSSLRMLREGGAFTPRTNRSSLNSADSTGSDVPPIPEPRNTQTTHNQLLIGASAMRTPTERQLAWTIRSRVQILRMLVVIVILFAVAWLPFRGLLVYNTFVSEPWLDTWYLFFAKTLIYCNSAMNPILYNIMSRRFRLAVHQTIFGKATKPLQRKSRCTPPQWQESLGRLQHRQIFSKNNVKTGKNKTSASNLIHNQQLDLFYFHYVPHVPSNEDD